MTDVSDDVFVCDNVVDMCGLQTLCCSSPPREYRLSARRPPIGCAARKDNALTPRLVDSASRANL